MDIVLAILVLLILPIAIIYAIWRWAPWGKDIKFVLTGVVAILYVIVFFRPSE